MNAFGTISKLVREMKTLKLKSQDEKESLAIGPDPGQLNAAKLNFNNYYLIAPAHDDNSQK